MNSTTIALAMVMGGAWLPNLHAAPASNSLESILGSSIDQWQITYYTGATNDYKLAKEDGRAVLIAGPNATLLTSLNKVTADSEITVRVRLGAAEGKATSLYFAPGLKNADETAWNPLFLNLQAPAAAEQETVICQMPSLPGQSQGVYIPYTVRSLPKSRTTWPEMVRSRVEQDVASVPSLGKRWLTIRCVVRKDSAQLYLDGQLLRDVARAHSEPEGHVRLSVYEGTQLASVRIRPLPPEYPIFETVQLDHHLNAAEKHPSPALSPKGRGTSTNTARRKISSPLAGEDNGEGYVLSRDGVPFLIPSSDARGNDHIDVGRSWMRFGALEGAFDPWEGETPRWRGMMSSEAGRIVFRVRNGRYSRLHLLASFDGDPDETPVVMAQFYRPSAGHPVNFSARVPKGKPRLVTIPLEPEGLASLSDQEVLEFELTKEVRIHRAFPDPCYYSQHGAGLPSGVHVYAMTLERPAVEVSFQPDKFAHIWTAPDKPSYTIRLRNNKSEEQEAALDLTTTSHDGTEKTSQERRVRVPAGGDASVTLPLELTRYGYHQVKLVTRDEQGTRTQTRSLAHLHPDTRERGGWEEGKGPLFGMWDWNGGHETPGGMPRLDVATAAGIQSSMKPLATGHYPPQELAYAEKHGMMTHFLAYQFHPGIKEHLGVEWDASKPDEMKAAVLATIKKSPLATPTKLNKPELAVFFGEPILGPVSYMSFPEYYGEPPYQMTADEQKAFKKIEDEFVIAASAIKKEWPNAKCLMPWGIPSFPIAFLRHSKEATELMDGPAIDLILFERLPEMQMHQVTYASTMWQLKQEWLKAGKKWPSLTTVEGVCTSPSMPGAITQQQEADHYVRGALLLAAYGTTRHLGMPSLFHCAGAWGEQHYGGGMCE